VQKRVNVKDAKIERKDRNGVETLFFFYFFIMLLHVFVVDNISPPIPMFNNVEAKPALQLPIPAKEILLIHPAPGHF
jgi:hypothetical protein